MKVSTFAEKKLSISADQLGTAPIINYINDYGGQVYLPYNCSATQCQTQQIK